MQFFFYFCTPAFEISLGFWILYRTHWLIFETLLQIKPPLAVLLHGTICFFSNLQNEIWEFSFMVLLIVKELLTPLPWCQPYIQFNFVLSCILFDVPPLYLPCPYTTPTFTPGGCFSLTLPVAGSTGIHVPAVHSWTKLQCVKKYSSIRYNTLVTLQY